ncbi:MULTISPECIES: class I SAM-dependent methyltransferase [unclassified Marinobacter]|uniref:class I SAM-dependent methyltransferase n=1 Tax=unclassified Marinobacter TaxID=83889 RepID=UPI0012695570|nr:MULTISPECIES: class I SAM-dependent methyltransferase [unclassified Marinobacter]QFS87785.1 hypothetical protein FIV08_13210 [Marinobacter sp. THAF197a]QFT51570.1 hypothetical protein FIU96_13120 [Marinobacter sp. THAF39]
MLNGAYCKICGGRCKENQNFTRFLALGETNCRVLTCENCKTSFLVGEPPNNLYNHEYFSVAGADYDYEKQSRSNSDHYQDIIEKLVSYGAGSASLVDIGCGMGHFVRQASASFEEVLAVDGHVDPSCFVGDRSQLSVEDIDRIEITPEKFDAITLNHSLEHVDDPVRLLEQAREGLRPGGVLYVEVPFQFGSFYDRVAAILSPKQAPDFLSFHHKTFFCPRSLELALENTGFEVLELRTFLPKRGVGRFRGLRGRLRFVFLWGASLVNRADYIAVFARRLG